MKKVTAALVGFVIDKIEIECMRRKLSKFLLHTTLDSDMNYTTKPKKDHMYLIDKVTGLILQLDVTHHIKLSKHHYKANA